MTSTITINGVTITTSRSGSISVSNGRVIIDGKDVTPDAKQITIEVNGDIHSISADICTKIAVTGSAGSVRTQSGDVECGPITGSVNTMSGAVRSGPIAGSASTMSGDITSSGRIHGGTETLSGRVRGEP
jgi:hypothetical protein